MAQNNEQMIKNIRKKLNIVNQSLINPEKFKDTDTKDIKDIHDFVMSKDSFSPSEITAIADTKRVIVLVVFSMVCRILSLFMVKISWAPWRWVNKLTMAFSAALVEYLSLIRTTILRTWACPNIRLMTVV